MKIILKIHVLLFGTSLNKSLVLPLIRIIQNYKREKIHYLPCYLDSICGAGIWSKINYKRPDFK